MAYGLSMRSLAQRAEISPAQVSRIENGSVEQPSVDTLVKLARALDRNPIPLWIVAGHVRSAEAVALMRQMLPADAEVFQEWGDEEESTAALALIASPDPDPDELRMLAAKVFKTFETEETLWETYVHRLGRGSGDPSPLAPGADQVRGVDRRSLALVEVSRHLPEGRLAKVIEYAKDQFEAEFGRPFLGSAELSGEPQEEPDMDPMQAEGREGRAFARSDLERKGFEGFVTVAALRSGGVASIPSAPGVYVVVNGAHAPDFLEQNPGGRFKQQDPTVALALLKAKWIDGSDTVYIGKGNDLRRRIRQFVDFGAGKPVGHWGGRYTWQLANADELLIAWMRAPEGEQARDVETVLLSKFVEEFGALPFANLVR